MKLVVELVVKLRIVSLYSTYSAALHLQTHSRYNNLFSRRNIILSKPVSFTVTPPSIKYIYIAAVAQEAGRHGHSTENGRERHRRREGRG